ncbi:hypothetical protein D9619_012470 [Psilocybe cf. subviscida]|uniref:F-box domain-containing protein n=1 Tax=Psilocybe cf. subviscida TaxID=2480587 RepID=A0A8H5ERA1_9AGAR|nr:hypothetical protein D9619_012470 [Psilocybe cf. subviscida]
MATLRLTLPADLFRPILEYGELDKADLCSVALASRLLREEGQHILFRDPGLIKVHAHGNLDRAGAFFDAMLSSPHRLALMVHSYTQTTDWSENAWSDQKAAQHSSPEELFTKMTQALKLMVNLKTFRSRDVGGSDSRSQFSMVDCIRQCGFKLGEFAWNHADEDMRLLEEFLVFQDDIEYLELNGVFDSGGVSDFNNSNAERLLISGKNVCPKLETLHGPMSNSMIFLPGKTGVKFLAWTWDIYAPDRLDAAIHAAHICASLNTLQYLEYKTHVDCGIKFTTIAPYLNTLVVLKISIQCIKEVSELSCGVPTLRAIHFFNERIWDFPNREEADGDFALVSSIFTLFEKLKFVDVDRDSKQRGRCGQSVVFSKRFIVSPETKELTSTQVNKSEENWWRDRVYLVSRHSAET